jgi:hypothetical protein
MWKYTPNLFSKFLDVLKYVFSVIGASLPLWAKMISDVLVRCIPMMKGHVPVKKKEDAVLSPPSVPFYSVYRFFAFVSEYKAVAWLFFSIIPSTDQLPHDMHEKKSI